MEVLEKLYYAPRIESTQTQLIQLFQKGLNSEQYGIYSFNQTQGKGQGTNTWNMDPESGLAISLGFKISTKQEPHDWVAINKHVSTLICTFLQRICEEPVYIKWPNDIMCRDKKLAGILMQVIPFQEPPEIQLNINQSQFDKLFVVGLGLNLEPSQNTNPEIQDKIISLQEVNHSKIEDQHILAQSLAGFLFDRGMNLPIQKSKVHEYYECCLWQLSETVVAQISIPQSQLLNAKLIGVDESGRVLLKIEEEIMAFQHGDARIMY